MEVVLHTGSLRAHVPEPAKGFRVQTTSGKIVDLGTEFAVSVTDDHTDLKVIEGEIEWHAITDRPTRLLTSGEGLRVSGEGQQTPLPDNANIASITAIDNEIKQRREARRLAWRAYSQELASDPRLILYYPMDAKHRKAKTLFDASGNDHDGTIVRRTRVNDRWNSADTALDFRRLGSQVRTVIDGEFTSLTLTCWARIDSLDRKYNSLFLTDGHNHFAPHWQIMSDGRLFFSVKALHGQKGPDKHIVYSPPIWNATQAGEWMHIATVFDGEAFTTTHYVDGQQVHHEVLPEKYHPEKIVIGPASIGNWNEPMRPDPAFALRNLNGAIDEFALFSEPLSAAEIEEMALMGRP